MQDDPSDSQQNSRFPALAVVGMAGIFPQAKDLVHYWNNIRDGVDAVTSIPEDTHWQLADYYDSNAQAADMTYARRGAFIDTVAFDPLFYGISPNNIEATDTTQLLGMHVARMALQDANYATDREASDGRPFDRDRCSVILGVTGTLELVIPLGARLGHPHWRRALQTAGVDKKTAEQVVQHISNAYVPWQENSFPGLLGNVVAGRIANRFDLGGTNCVVDAACASSLSALHTAAMELHTGHCDIAITGGMDTFNDIFMYMCFSKTPALSPSGDSRPFSTDGDGTILGEGLGVVVLKRLADAERDGDSIRAIIRGIGSASDGRGNAIYSPSAEGQKKCLHNAYRSAQVTPASIGLVEAHGTGTRVGDSTELSALSSVYDHEDNTQPWCALGSVKSMIGHTKAAAGVASLIKCILALQHKVLPPTLKIKQPLPQLAEKNSPFYLNTNKRPWVSPAGQARRAAVSAFGFGGSNFHCVLEEYPDSPKVHIETQILLFSFSAETAEELRTMMATLMEVPRPKEATWEHLRHHAWQSRQNFNPAMKHRLCFVLDKHDLPHPLLAQIWDALHHSMDKLNSCSDKVWYKKGTSTGKLALICPGQGAQYVGMMKDLACQFPQFTEILQQVEKYLPGLTEYIYPLSASPSTEDTLCLQQTCVAQPALAAVEIAAFQVLQQFGLRIDVCAGHSFGELVALHAGGRINTDDCLRLAVARGEVMHSAATGTSSGGMAAVFATRTETEKLLQENNLDLVIANHNAPNQVVVSGSITMLEKCLQCAQKNKLQATLLPVSAAFHSPSIAVAVESFQKILAETTFQEATLPVYANSTAQQYPVTADSARQLLAEQLLQPVLFVDQIRQLYADDVRYFIEIGPDQRLTGLIRQILAEQQDIVALSLDASRGKTGSYDIACLLAQLAAEGRITTLTDWDAMAANAATETGKSASTLRIPLCGANHVNRTKKQPATTINTDILQDTAQPVQEDRPSAEQPVITHSQTAAASNISEQAILTLQQMQEQTIALHQQYLNMQQSVQQNIHQLLQNLYSSDGSTIATTPNTSPEILESALSTPVTHLAKTSSIDNNTPPAATQATIAVAQDTPTDTNKVTETPAASRQTVNTNTNSDIQTLLLQVIAEKTGYPPDMLELSMRLDEDLGIDSIKRVEILSAMQERLPSLPALSADALTQLHTLEEIVIQITATLPSTPFSAAPPPDSPAATTGGDTTALATDTHNDITQLLLDVVAEKTGYPLDMLELSMRLDEDLGIDSIKRVEILSAMQERLPSLPALHADALTQLHTLEEIVARITVTLPATPALSATPPSDSATSPAATTGGSAATAIPDDMTRLLLDVVAEKTGYPPDMLELSMRLDEDLGIDSIKRVEILSAMQERLPSLPALNADALTQLHTLQEIVDYTEDTATTKMSSQSNVDNEGNKNSIAIDQAKTDNSPDVAVTTTTMPPSLQISQVQSIPFTKQRTPITLPASAVIRICCDTSSPQASALKTLLMENGWNNVSLITLDPQVLQTESGIDMLLFLVEDNILPVTRILLLLQAAKNALHSNARLTAILQLDGHLGLNGLTTHVNTEQYAIAGLLKTANIEWPDIHCRIIDTTPDVTTENLYQELLWDGPVEIGLTNQQNYGIALKTSTFDIDLEPPVAAGDIVVVTGGARGITAAVAQQIAQQWQVQLHLIGRTEYIPDDPSWAEGCKNEISLKQALREAHPELKPMELQTQCQQLLKQRELRANLSAIQGATTQAVHYHTADICDAVAMEKVMVKIVSQYGAVRGVIHGAGILADRLIEDQTTKQISSVWRTKIDGITHLLTHCDPALLRFLVCFSSTTARFGRKGQGAYAAANEALNKFSQQLKNALPDCRCISINWGPWAGGMVTEELRPLFAREGIGLIREDQGAKCLLQLLCSSATTTETVVLATSSNENTTDIVATDNTLAVNETQLRTSFNINLTVNDFPCLSSHVMNGQAVLPVALILEWFAHGAMHNNPGLQFCGIEDFYLYKGIRIDTNAHWELAVCAGELLTEARYPSLHMELRSKNQLHARAKVQLGEETLPAPATELPLPAAKYSLQQDYYQDGRLFHQTPLQALQSVSHCDETGIAAYSRAAVPVEQWLRTPVRSTWISDPMALDAAFQLMILWCEQFQQAPSLPAAIGRYHQFCRQFPEEIQIVARITAVRAQRVCADIEFIDPSQQSLLARLYGYECICEPSLTEAFQARQLNMPKKNVA